MENVHLIQKTILGKNEFTLEKDGIHARQKKNGAQWEFRMPYEQIGFDTVRKTDNQMKYGLYIAVVLYLIMIIGLVDFIISEEKRAIQLFAVVSLTTLITILTVRAWRAKNIAYIYLQVGLKRIEMFSNVPDEQTVQAFIAQVHARIRNKHKEAFFRQPDSVPLEIRIKQLEWLIAIKAITEAERDDYLKNVMFRNIPLN